MAVKFHHLRQINQTYFQHFGNALSYAFVCQKASMYFVMHALFPDTAVNDGSTEIKKLHDKLSQTKDKMKTND
jgi:hypothetical protein